ncbi:MAG: hypothetical protein JWP08_4545 [Bryobacterales bacterium]|jgi:hypothetical protein|nr:hypothetical protein [Bryobacterales bacterium]
MNPGRTKKILISMIVTVTSAGGAQPATICPPPKFT